MSDPTANERVRRRMIAHGFPAGLLPDCIVADEYDEQTGRFAVTLATKVRTTIDGFPVRYATVIRGVIQPDTIRELEGVQAKRMLWIGISGIDAGPETLLFRVGPVKQPVSRSAFS